MYKSHSPDFLDKIPIGVYKLTAKDQIDYANHAWLELHGYQDLGEVRGRNINISYAHPEKANHLKTEIIEKRRVKDRVFEMQKPNGEHFWISLYSSAIYDDDGNYAGREGIVHDVTEREIHRRIAHTIPIGCYCIETINGIDQITYCNQEFVEMFGFKRQKDVIGYDISQLYRDKTDYEEFCKRVQHSKDDIVRHREVEAKNLNGDCFWVETNIKLQRDESGNYTGRIGVIRDLSKDLPLQRLRKDLGNVLHSFTTGLIAIKSDIDAALAALGPPPFQQQRDIQIEILLDKLKGPTSILLNNLDILVQTLSDRDNKYYPEFVELKNHLGVANKQQETFRAQVLRDIAYKIATKCQTILGSRHAPREPLKQVRQDAYELMRIFAWARLCDRGSDVLQMENELRSLRACMTTPSHTTKLPQTKHTLWTLVIQAMNNLHDVAASRGIEFKPAAFASQASIQADERDMLRVVTNLLHNAVKYSWSRESGTWIDVNLYQQGSLLQLEIENYGVPISEDEISSELIFEFGYRSRLSTDRGRVGTGIGLADTRQTLRRYGGKIEIQSRPASIGGIAEKRDPYVTTAIVTIPVAS